MTPEIADGERIELKLVDGHRSQSSDDKATAVAGVTELIYIRGMCSKNTPTLTNKTEERADFVWGISPGSS